MTIAIKLRKFPTMQAKLVKFLLNRPRKLASFSILHMLIALLLLLASVVCDELSEYTQFCPQECICADRTSPNSGGNLKTMDCSFASMKVLPDIHIYDLESLNIKGNALGSVDRSVARLYDLKEMDISGNEIKSIGRGKMFQNMTKLEYLNAGKNDISTIFHDTFQGPKRLKILILSNNKINYIEDEAFIDLNMLTTLNLEQNLLGSLYEEWFVGLQSLENLNLAHNRVHNIPANVFRPLQSLTQLSLAGNRISNIDLRAFSGLSRLRDLTLQNNLITKIPTVALESMTSLDSILFDMNPVVKIKSLDFAHLSVSKISICRMPELAIIDAKAFYTIRNLTALLIRYNKKLSYVDPLAFMNINNLKELNLAYNNLKGIQREVADYLPSGVKVHFYGNPLDCSCDARWLRLQMNPSINSTFKLIEPEHLVCHTPAAFTHKLLRDIDLAKLPKKCAPSILNFTQRNEIIVKVGEMEILECRAMGSPQPKLYWVLPDGAVVNTTLNEVHRRFFPPGSLHYYHINPTDAGVFECIAENSAGNDSSFIKLTVTGIDIHLFPIAVSSTFVTLVWNGTERLAFPQYKIIYGPDNGQNGTLPDDTYFAVASQSRKSYTISRLKPDTRYRFCIGVEDTSGYWLEISCCTAITQDAQFMLQGFSKPNNVAVAAIGFILFLALIVCLLSVASRRYRQRLYECPDKRATVNGSDDSSAITTNSAATTGTSGSSTIPLDNLYRPLLNSS